MDRVAVWDGEAWQPLGSGLNGAVYALAIDSHGNVYAAGSFTMAGDLPVNRVAMWDGANWWALDSGINGDVHALVIDSADRLYAGGSFSTAGHIVASGVARWNGSHWSAVGSSSPYGVRALAIDPQGMLYAGGRFTWVGQTNARYVARWNGSSWSGLGSGLDNDVDALAIDGSGTLYVGGRFGSAGGVSARRVARWDGSSWSALERGVAGRVTTLALGGDGDVFAGGEFLLASGLVANYISRWDGTLWTAVGDGIHGNVYALLPDGAGGVRVGYGSYYTHDPEAAAHWTGSNWVSMGTGAGSVYDLVSDGSGTIYGAGVFRVPGHTYPARMAQWDGAWKSLPSSPCCGGPHSIAVDRDNRLYVAGNFSNWQHLWMWDGETWSSPGERSRYGYIGALVIDDNNNVYIGLDGGIVERWDGSNWRQVGGALGGWVYALAVDAAGNVYAGGSFHAANAMGIAMWDGTNWRKMEGGVNGTVRALTWSDAGHLYVGGEFTRAGGQTANRVARWNGNTWSSLGSGVDGPVYALAIEGEKLWVGGYFQKAGNKPSANFALWEGVGAVALEEEPSRRRGSLDFNIYPNPFTLSTTIAFDLVLAEQVALEIYDLLGRRIALLVDSNLQPGLHQVQWNADDIASGVYVVRLVAGDAVESRRLLLLR